MLALGVLVLAAGVQAHAQNAKNIVLMVADGASYNAWNMASYYQYGALGSQPYDSFPVKYAVTTYPLTTSTSPTGDSTPQVSYNSASAWSTPPTTDGTYFAGYRYLKQNPTDSAAAATALATGVKTYNNAINYSNSPAGTGTPLVTIAELAKAHGKAAGVVTSVEWSHATPAALGAAHNVDRDNYAAIANEMLTSSTLDVIMGAGSPDYTVNGTAQTGTKDYKFVGGQATWTALQTGTHAGGWTLVESKTAFEALMSGDTPDRVLGTAQVSTTLQQDRGTYAAGEAVYGTAFNSNVPTLTTMTRGALNVLDNDPDGFFLMVEGGAVDWAAHDKQASRAIEEFIDFNNAVQAVITWVNANSNWNETLLIITTDHGNGLPLGPNANTTAFQAIVNNGAGAMPGMKWEVSGHTNELVPLFAKGAGSSLFTGLVDGTDSVRGSYIDNTDVYTVMAEVVPEPATLALVGAGVLLALRRRRR